MGSDKAKVAQRGGPGGWGENEEGRNFEAKWSAGGVGRNGPGQDGREGGPGCPWRENEEENK